MIGFIHNKPWKFTKKSSTQSQNNNTQSSSQQKRSNHPSSINSSTISSVSPLLFSLCPKFIFFQPSSISNSHSLSHTNQPSSHSSSQTSSTSNSNSLLFLNDIFLKNNPSSFCRFLNEMVE